jgi:hypothetical protein
MTVLSRVWSVNKKCTLTGNIFHRIRFLIKVSIRKMYVCVNWKEAKYSNEKRIEFDKIPYYNKQNGTIILLRLIIYMFLILLCA